ncbi:MAG TPA: hypothetical protein VNW46_05410 [Gemmatimonadaceae bacterium]|jgi:hypothetical protein|nr:hypothetical protein [Gemmatimonadaceae bacterium]
MATERPPLFSDIRRWFTAGPRWLFGKVTQAFLFAVVAPLDAIMQWIFEGVRARFPGAGPAECDPFVARNAGIYPGRVEPRAAWAARAAQWLRAWRRAGSPFAILEQLSGFFAPNPPPLYIVTDSGHWYARMPPGVGAPAGMVGTAPEFTLPLTARPPITASNWIWDPYTGVRWSRFWVVVDMSGGPFTHPNQWGGAGLTWGLVNLTWGSNATTLDIAGMRDAVIRFMPAASQCLYIIFDFGGHFQPTGSGAGYPAGNWQYWANRYQPAAYVSVP